MDESSRRRFLKCGLTAGAAALGSSALDAGAQAAHPGRSRGEGDARPIRRPVAISSANGLPAVTRAIEGVRKGEDSLDAVIAGVNIVENDPDDVTVGYGGLPNERGVVQLDASVMHGPTHNAGAVASLERIRHPSKVAKLVMERTDHVILVGPGALEFARLHGFPEENLVTEKSRKIYLYWKETLSGRDDWFPSGEEEKDPDLQGYIRDHGTINCNVVDPDGNLSGVTTTSGLFFKIPGRIGDSPIIGAGLYVDNQVGACGATGRGEAVILSSGSHAVVTRMSMGDSPEQACLAVLEQIVARSKMPELLDGNGRPNFNVKLYALNRNGGYGSAAIWNNSRFAVHDGTQARLEDCAFLFKRS